MLKRILDALAALLSDTPVLNRLLEQMKQWGETQEEARRHLVSVLTEVVQSFERSHAIVLIELSRLTAAESPQQYKALFDKLDHGKFYRLFKTNKVCENVHNLQAELKSGFGDIGDAIVLGAARRLERSLGEFEHYEYSLAQRYVDYLRTTLFSPHRVKSDDSLAEAIQSIIDREKELSEELNLLTGFKRRIFELSLYNRP